MQNTTPVDGTRDTGLKQEPPVAQLSTKLGEIVGFSLFGTSPESREVVLIGATGLIHKIDLKSSSRQAVGQVLGPVFSGAVGNVAVAGEDSKQAVLAVANERGASLYEFPSLQHLGDLPSTLVRFNTIAFDTARKNILLGGGDGVVYRWKLFNRDGEFSPTRHDSLERYFGHSASIIDVFPVPKVPNVFFSVDEAGLVSGFRAYDSDRFGGEYDENLFNDRAFADEATRKSVQLKSNAPITANAISSDGQLMALGGQDGSLEVIGTKAFARKAIVKNAHRGDILSLAFLTSNGTDRLLASVGRDGQLVLWRIDQKLQEGRASQLEYQMLPLKFSTIVGGNQIIAIGPLELAVATNDSKVLALKFTL